MHSKLCRIYIEMSSSLQQSFVRRKNNGKMSNQILFLAQNGTHSKLRYIHQNSLSYLATVDPKKNFVSPLPFIAPVETRRNHSRTLRTREPQKKKKTPGTSKTAFPLEKHEGDKRKHVSSV